MTCKQNRRAIVIKPRPVVAQLHHHRHRWRRLYTSARTATVALAVLALSAVASNASNASNAAQQPDKKAAVFCDRSLAPVQFAAGEVARALQHSGFTVQQKAFGRIGDDRSPVRVLLSVGDPKQDRAQASEFLRKHRTSPGGQSYVIATSRSRRHLGDTNYHAVANGPIGAMYGGLEIAESIRIHKGPDGITPTHNRPYIRRRGIKFNIPLDVRTPSYDDTGDAAQKNYRHMWELSFWREFLDDMARHRYNTLTLWNPHPFPSIVKCPNYPDVALDDVCITTLKPTYKSGAWRDPQHVYPEVLGNLKVVKRLTIDEKIAFWRSVMKHAKQRGIDVYLITWNVLTNGTQGKYGINNDQDNLTTIAYLRESVCQTILTYPDLAGIGVTAGENMRNRDDEFSKEKWLWKTYGLGVVDAKKEQPDRHVRFLHRVWQTGVGGIVEDFGAKYPDTFEVGFKYARAHMYSSPDPPFDDALCEELKEHKVKCWWNLRNDDIFNFRWGDPQYVRQFIRHLPPPQITAGYHMGSDGYVWAVEHTSTEPDSPRQLEIRKHWYNFMLWGRLGYDPSLDSEFFTKVLAARFPEAAGCDLQTAWADASKIIPLVNRFHWNNWDFMWAVEICSDQRNGFHTVDKFINTPPMERSGLTGIPEYVDRVLAGGRVAGAKRSGAPGETAGASLRSATSHPPQVAGRLAELAKQTLSRLQHIRKQVPKPGKQLRLTLGDVEAMAHLGSYYSAKILGAVELCAFRKSGDHERKQAAVGQLERAVEHWRSYAKAASSQYHPQLLARTRRTDWMEILEDVKRDVEIARRATAQ